MVYLASIKRTGNENVSTLLIDFIDIIIRRLDLEQHYTPLIYHHARSFEFYCPVLYLKFVQNHV